MSGSDATTRDVLHNVRSAYRAGLTLLPAAADGSKRPALPEWGKYQHERPTPDVMRRWDFANRAGFGLIAGPVSDHAESWDFDDADTFSAFVEAAATIGLADVIQRIRDGYEDQTPNGGRRWIVKYPADVTWIDTVYARRPGRPGEKHVVTLIETTLFAILAPSQGSVHPSGRPYMRVSGGFDTIAAYTADERAAVIALARSFDQLPRRPAVPSSTTNGTRPGDDFNSRATWPEILTPHGWTAVGCRGPLEYWRRPDKDFGISASTNQDTGLLWVFTSSTPLAPDVSYSKFGAFSVLEHGGDHAAAAKALALRGYGVLSPPGSTGSAPAVVAQLRQLRTIQASTMPIGPVRWLWHDRIPLGNLTLIGGREGIGKSLCTAWIAAQVTNGTLPGAFRGVPRAVFIVATEDSWKHTIVPRLMAAGADLTRVFAVDVVAPTGINLSVSLPQDLEALEREARQREAGLLVFDPLMSRLDSSLDTHKDASVRQALEPVVAMADRLEIAVLGVVHVSKARSSDALTLLMGSRAFAAVARSVLFAMIDPDDDTRRLVGEPKNNLGRTDLETMTFSIDGVCVATTAQGEVWTGRLEWGASSDRTIHDALECLADQRGDQEVVVDASTWLVDYLTDAGGMAAADTIVKAGQGAGFSRATMYRAQKKLQLLHRYQGFPRTAYWSLSSQCPRPGQLGTAETTETAAQGSQLCQLSQLSQSFQADRDDATTEPAWLAADSGSEDSSEAPFADRDAEER